MLGKLLKYEIKATGRIFLPMYVAVLFFAGINKLFMITKLSKSHLDFLANITIFIYVMIILATFTLTFVVMIQRFYKNLLGDEGYLMFTLPVKPSAHILSKMITSMMWLIISAVVTILSVFILIADQSFFQDLGQAMQELSRVFNQAFGSSGGLIIAELIIITIVSIFSSTLMIYASIAIGHTVSNNHKVLASFGSYMVITVIMQIITSLITAIPVMTNMANWMDMANADTMEAAFDLIRYMSQMFLPITLAIDLLFGVLFFLVTNYIFTKKLNLE